MKVCTKCNKGKEITDFHERKRSKDGRDARCKVCRGEYMVGYKTRPEVKIRNLDNTNKQRFKQYEQLKKYLLDKSCKDCGIGNWLVLEFDHLADKTSSVSKLLGSYQTWERILQEINKCDIVCANCHRIRTFKRGNQWRWKLR